jgi:hypothetical protein
MCAMKCYDFETSITEMLNGQLEDSRRREMLDHSLACKKCDAILRKQQSLNLELQTLVASDSSEEAAPEIEQRLAAAFRAHLKAPQSFSRSAGASSPFAALRSFLAGQNKWKYATAAVSLAFCILISHRVLHRQPAAPVKTVSQIQLIELLKPAPAIQQPVGPEVGIEAEKVAVVRSTPLRSRIKRNQAGIKWITAEIATDFYAIPYVERFRPNDRVRVVRIEVPSSTLADFGLPVYSDQATYPIQADVMVGDDNIARFIRFVRQWRLPQNQSSPSLKALNN